MIVSEIGRRLVLMKNEFARTYSGGAHVQEIVPDDLLASRRHLDALDGFMHANPIYTSSHRESILDSPCTVYEGDLNEYWLGSIKHGSSCQPFYPTWIMSAYAMTMMAVDLGYRELVDVGSGDGRIAFCGRLHGLKAHSIEIDGSLAGLQESIAEHTGVDFDPICADALEYDYSKLGLERPAFFVGGLPQMGGDVLASSVVNKAIAPAGPGGACIVLVGSLAKRQLSGNADWAGWGPFLQKHGLGVETTIVLPAVWTFDQQHDAPYMYAGLRQDPVI